MTKMNDKVVSVMEVDGSLFHISELISKPFLVLYAYLFMVMQMTKSEIKTLGRIHKRYGGKDITAQTCTYSCVVLQYTLPFCALQQIKHFKSI